MKQEEFGKLFESTFEELRQLLLVKGGEYAGEGDRLANFKRGAEHVGATPLQVALIYASKHWDSIATFVRDEAEGKARPRSEPIAGRFHDLMNYCILMLALIREGHAVEAPIERAPMELGDTGDRDPLIPDRPPVILLRTEGGGIAQAIGTPAAIILGKIKAHTVGEPFDFEGTRFAAWQFKGQTTWEKF